MLAHAIESYVSVKANPFSEMLSEKAITTVGKCLLALKENIGNHEARKDMSFASMIMGMNLKDVGTALPHRLQYPVGAATDSSHGAGLIALYPSWISHEYHYSAEKVSRAMKLLADKDVIDADMAKEAMIKFLSDIGTRRTLTGLGIEENSPHSLAQRVTGNIKNDSLSVEEGIIERIYSESM